MLAAGAHDMAFEGGAPLSVTASTVVGLGMILIADADERPIRRRQRSGMRCLSDRDRRR
jgi:hypothetical protein